MLTFPDQSFITTECQGDQVLILCSAWRRESDDIVFSEHWIRNKKHKIAILRYGARFRIGSKIPNGTRKNNDVSLQRRRYYIAYSNIASYVRQFYRDNNNTGYTLLVDVCTFEHSCVLYITHSKKGRVPSYSFRAFDPNYTCNSHNFVEVAKAISESVTTIPVWCSRTPNTDDLCFTLSWRFIHALMFDGYDAISNEKVISVYNVKSRRPMPVKHEKGAPRKQLVGYYVTREFNRKVIKLKIIRNK